MSDPLVCRIEKKDGSIVKGIQAFFKDLLESKFIDALFLPMGKAKRASIMPALVTDPALLGKSVPFSPCFPLNAGRMASRISHRDSGRNTAVFMRPCEMKAFVELVKLKQGKRDELVLIGTDCCGALTWKDWAEYVQKNPLDGDDFVNRVFTNYLSAFDWDLNGLGFSMACKTCEHPFPNNTDINLVLYGTDVLAGVLVQAVTKKGKKILEAMDLPQDEMPGNLSEIKEQVRAAGEKANEAMCLAIEEKTNTMAKLETFFDRCINCYNCRNMCPVCYCRECVFNTEVFSHLPVQYLQWAENKGLVKLPTDTLFYHLTRMAHMSHACVGCGQCSNACPSDIPVFELFKSVGALTQNAFGYLPGNDENAPPPLSVFQEKELEDVVGIG